MDTVTHAVVGALVGAAVSRQLMKTGDTTRMVKRLLVVTVAAEFPDIDYVVFWIDPLAYLAKWHRSLTHSVVLLPLWSMLLGVGFARLYRRQEEGAGNVNTPPKESFASLVFLSAVGIASHIFLDLIEIFGLKLWYPLSDASVSLGTSFVVDPILTGIAVIALIAGLRQNSQRVCLLGLASVLAYVGFQGLLKHSALQVAYSVTAQGRGGYAYALPRPLSPFYWQLLLRRDNEYDVAALNLLGGDQNVSSGADASSQDGWFSYRPATNLHWRSFSLFGSSPSDRTLVETLWWRPDFADFRKFAVFPVLDRITRTAGEECVWFTDLRYVIPGLLSPFRYGYCRMNDSTRWRLYRVRYMSLNDRQAIGSSHD